MNLGDRADAEYFSKENLAIEHALRYHHATPLRELCALAASAFYPAATDLYGEGDVPFARCVDCIEYPVITRHQDADFVRIPEWFVEQSAQIDCVTRGDIIITKVGSPCFASLVQDYDRIALSRTVLGLVKIHGVSPYYLTAFLRSRFGFTQLLRQREQTIQYQLTLDRVRDVLIYRASTKLQSAIERVMLQYIAASEDTHRKAENVEGTLTAMLGLAEWQPPTPLTYTRRASEAFASERLDAEHFQELYYALADKLRSYPRGCLTLGELCPNPVNGVEIREYADEGVPYLRVGDLHDFTISGGGVKRVAAVSAAAEIEKVRLVAGDVLVSRSGSLAVTGVVEPDWAHSVISSHLIRVRLINSDFDPYYVAAFLAAMPGKMQIVQQSNGGVQPEINQPSLKRILVPRLLRMDQQKVRASIHAAHTARQRAHALLDAAKRAVEIAIEESEAAALAYLKTQGA